MGGASSIDRMGGNDEHDCSCGRGYGEGSWRAGCRGIFDRSGSHGYGDNADAMHALFTYKILYSLATRFLDPILWITR